MHEMGATSLQGLQKCHQGMEAFLFVDGLRTVGILHLEIERFRGLAHVLIPCRSRLLTQGISVHLPRT